LIRDTGNRVALITGGAHRLGKAIAIAVAESGYDVILNYFHSKPDIVKKAVKEIGKKGVKVYPIKCDVSNVKDIKRMFVNIGKKFGKLDLLVNNSAIFEKIDLFDIDEKIFDNFIDTNLKSVLFCSIEGAKLMTKNRNRICRIINIASLGGILNWQDYIPYCVSKAGVIKLTKLMAKKLAPYILVNAIAPGTIYVENDENITVDIKEMKKYPLKKFGKERDIKSLIKYLINENEFITGQTLIIDGGRCL
jgi:NAD(P)-dependent dehydrogenase (short-subunit alcohol dehydrogenase family)